jgi:NAD(P)-dependent dehydrogenase (short-subunit alcohol dehydrogenase family)
VKNGNLFDLRGRVAIITGGGGLLAPEHATALCDHGATVVLADIDADKSLASVEMLRRAGVSGVHAKTVDVTSRESWRRLLAETVADHGKVDVLVNNAAMTNQTRSANFGAAFEDFPLEDWQAVLDVNLTGVLLGCQIVGRHMLERSAGAIVNLASLYGVVSPNHKMYPGTGISQPVAYTVSKHGVIGLTRYLGTLWAGRGVRVNALTPGGIFNDQTTLFVERFAHLSPIGRMSRKDELRGALVYLVSDASSHVVGHNLVVDGGWTVW